MEVQNESHYREELLKWCDHIHLFWESMKPKFSRLFDLKSLEEWDLKHSELRNKLRSDLKVNMDDYYSALNLYEQCALFNSESQGYTEELNSDVKTNTDFPIETDNAIAISTLTREITEEPDQEWNKLIQMADNLGVSPQEIQNFLLSYNNQ